MAADGMKAMIKVKRAYDSVEAEEVRLLVYRLWPRGIGKKQIESGRLS
jgi:uncharacterized protein YeaO (DUF488 family)